MEEPDVGAIVEEPDVGAIVEEPNFGAVVEEPDAGGVDAGILKAEFVMVLLIQRKLYTI